MNNFKIGDKVRRVNHPFCDMKVGDTGVIVGFRSGGNLEIEGRPYIYDPANFELVEDEKESTAKWLKENRWYIRTGSPEKSAAVQAWLFDHGIGWYDTHDAYVVYGTHYKMLTNTCSDRATGNIMWSVNNDHTSKIAKEITLEFETIVKSFTLPSVETEQEKKIRELQETIDKASAQIKAIKEMK